MPTQAVIASALSKWDALDPSHFPGGVRPPAYLDSAPLVDGVQVYPPYAVLRDEGREPFTTGFERTNLEQCRFSVTLYYETAAGADQAARAVRLNGGGVGGGLGFDYGTLPDLAPPFSSFQVLRTGTREGLAGYGRTGARTHFARLDYRVVVKEAA